MREKPTRKEEVYKLDAISILVTQIEKLKKNIDTLATTQQATLVMHVFVIFVECSTMAQTVHP